MGIKKITGVVLARRAGFLKVLLDSRKDEILLISKYRAVRPTSRNLISAYVQGIYDKENKI